MTKKTDAKSYTCEHCGGAILVAPGSHPVAPYCPACGNPVQQIADDFKAEYDREAEKALATLVGPDAAAEAKRQAPRVFTATGSICAGCGAEAGHKPVENKQTGETHDCEYIGWQ